MHPVFLLGFRLVWPKATVFEIVIIGSNPITPANLYRYSIMDNTLRYERGNRGSIPFGGTNCFSSVGTNSFATLLKDDVNSLHVL